MKTKSCLLPIFLACVLLTSSCTSATVTPVPQAATPAPNPTATATVAPPPTRQGLIAFYMKQGNMGGGIYVIRADGSGEPVMLSAHPSNDSKPTWSPDGSKLAFESLRDDVAAQKHLDIYIMNADGSHLERVTNTDGWYTEPEWSPDGNYLAMASHGEDSSNLDIYLLDLRSKELSKVTDGPDIERTPSWSPDGSRLVYASNAGGSWNIFTVELETGETSQLTREVSDSAQPDWSPDGQKILFISKRDGGDVEIYVMDSNGENQRRLTTTPGLDTDPEWSLDGNYFAYAHGDSKFGEIFVSDLNGSSPELLFENTSQYAGFPAWSASATISDKPVFGPPFCLHDTNGDQKPDAATNTFSTEEMLPYIAFPYRSMDPNLTTSVHWDYENSDMDSLNMALAWKHGESGWYVAPAGGLPLSTIGPGNVTIKLSIGDEVMQEITCEIVETSAASLPGTLVLPVDTLGESIPWLPLDENSRPAVHYIAFNTKIPPFNSALVRQAFAYAIDRQVIAEMAKKYKVPNPSPATTLTPPGTLGRDLYNEVGATFDPEKAKALLTEAGYSDPSAFPPVTLIVSAYGETAPGARFNMAKAMADMWQEYLGVSVQVEVIEKFKDYGNRIKTNPPELFWQGWAADVNDPDNFLRDIFHSNSEYNYGKFSNSEFDQLVDRAARSTEPADRQKLYIQAERLLCEEEAALIPLFHTH